MAFSAEFGAECVENTQVYPSTHYLLFDTTRLSPPHPLRALLPRPGSCVSVRHPSESCAERSRPYSIVWSGPSHFGLLVRRVPDGVVSNWLCALSPGQSVTITEIFRHFEVPATSHFRESLFVSTGVGIAPFISALRLGVTPMQMLVGCRTLEAMPGLATLLSDVQRECCTFVVSQPELFISKSVDFKVVLRRRVTDVLRTLPFPAEPSVYLCGLDAMVLDAYSLLTMRGVSAESIHSEVFHFGKEE